MAHKNRIQNSTQHEPSKNEHTLKAYNLPRNESVSVKTIMPLTIGVKSTQKKRQKSYSVLCMQCIRVTMFHFTFDRVAPNFKKKQKEWVQCENTTTNGRAYQNKQWEQIGKSWEQSEEKMKLDNNDNWREWEGKVLAEIQRSQHTNISMFVVYHVRSIEPYLFSLSSMALFCPTVVYKIVTSKFLMDTTENSMTRLVSIKYVLLFMSSSVVLCSCACVFYSHYQ